MLLASLFCQSLSSWHPGVLYLSMFLGSELTSLRRCLLRCFSREAKTFTALALIFSVIGVEFRFLIMVSFLYIVWYVYLISFSLFQKYTLDEWLQFGCISSFFGYQFPRGCRTFTLSSMTIPMYLNSSFQWSRFLSIRMSLFEMALIFLSLIITSWFFPALKAIFYFTHYSVTESVLVELSPLPSGHGRTE